MSKFNRNNKNENPEIQIKFQADFNDIISKFGTRQIQLCKLDPKTGLALELMGRFDSSLQMENWLKKHNEKSESVVWGTKKEIDEIVENDNRQYMQKRTYR